MTSGDLFPSAGDGSEGSDEPQRLATPDLEDAGEILQRWGWERDLRLSKYAYIYIFILTYFNIYICIYMCVLWVSNIYIYILYGFQRPNYMGLKWFEPSWFSKVIPNMVLKEPPFGVSTSQTCVVVVNLGWWSILCINYGFWLVRMVNLGQ